MTSLSEVYAGGVGTVASRRRQLLGTGLFVAGAAMVVGAIPIATTNLAAEFGLDVYGARELAGVLAGLGLPAVFVGIFTVLPAGRATRAAAVIGASVAVLGVAVFSVAYPYSWLGSDPALAVGAIVIYATGTLVTFWCLFVGVATFKTRNEPGGTARIEITDEGTVRVIAEDTPSIPGFGSVGLFGNSPDGEVDTQTNREEEGTIEANPTTDDATVLGEDDPRERDAPVQAGRRPASDGAGGVQTAEGSNRAHQPEPEPPATDVHDAVRGRGSPDEYCGNCRHFRYVRAGDSIAPYCGFHDGLLEDMDACDHWDPNS